jgi:hypothetical protein
MKASLCRFRISKPAKIQKIKAASPKGETAHFIDIETNEYLGNARLPSFPSVLRSGLPRSGSEETGEVEYVGDPHSGGDIPDGALGLGQQEAGSADAD